MIQKEKFNFDKQNIERIEDAFPCNKKRALIIHQSGLLLSKIYTRFPKDIQTFVEKASEKVRFHWTYEMQSAFEALKRELITAPVFVYPFYEKPFVLFSDASRKAVDAALSQPDENGWENLVRLAIRVLSEAKINTLPSRGCRYLLS